MFRNKKAIVIFSFIFITLLVIVIIFLKKTNSNKLSDDSLINNEELLSFGKYKKTTKIDKLTRSYTLYIPHSYLNNESLPLIIALHPEGVTGEEFADFTKLSQVNSQENFILITPDAIKNEWSDGRKIKENNQSLPDDVKFISTLIDEAIQKYNVNKGKIFVTGFSSGGIMTLRLACELSDKINAVAIVGATFPKDYFKLCQPINAVPIIIINSTNDNIIPYQGGKIISDLITGETESNDNTIDFWVNNNGCKPDPTEYIFGNNPLTHIEREDYQGGDAVTLYQVVGGAHSWPLGINTGQDINATDLIWKFFKNGSSY